ncbi:hypothetical protein ACFXMT_14325 [Streptomyces mirabilis]|uniref:hypothetical protein n=1 Tax=Streptomyces mirabilis TaxID=68239 RepID=UPI0036A7FB1B
MARVDIPVVAFTRGGTVMADPITGDVANGHALANDGRVGLIVKNTSSTTQYNVTLRLSRTVDGQSVSPRVEPVPFGKSKAFGPFAPGDYGTSLLVDVDNVALTLIAVRVS